jgi:cell wall-associated NlpC family hydrolase
VIVTAAVPTAPLRAAPDPSAEQLDQLLLGEGFEVWETRPDWSYGRALRDGYVGWVVSAFLAPGAPSPTHRVAALRTIAASAPRLRAHAGPALSLNALVRIEAEEAGYALAAGVGWIVAGHLAPLGTFEADPAAVAERFVGAPYLWGGRCSIGLDCSGLVQQALYACGRACRRDSNLQAEMGEAVDRAELRRGDLVFWDGHVGMMLDATRLIHATAHHMAVVVEPLDEVVARRIALGEGPPTGFRRLRRV